MARLTRQQLKKDELAERFAAIREYLLQNQRNIVIATTTAVVAVGVVLGGFLYVRSRQTRASGAFALAMTTFHAPVMENLPPNSNPNALYFKTSSEKYQQALQQFTEVAGRYSRLSQGKFASYYASLCERELGKFPEAEKELSAIAAGRDRDLAALAKMAMASIYEQTGRNQQAEKLYQDLEARPTDTVPKATIELALAELYQKTNPAQAMALYKKIQTEYPGTAAGDQASKMLQAQAH